MFSLLPRPTRKTGIDLSDYCHAADTIGCSVSMVRAVDAVESAGRGFLPSGRPKILFEGYLFHKFTGGRFDRTNPSISYPVWTKVHYRGGEAEYERLEQAYKLDPRAALRATSWSRFQILGDNYAMCGFTSVEAFVEAMFLDEDNSLEAFVLYIMHRGLRDAMRRKDADAVAYGYNGKSYRRNNYGVKIANADREFAKIKIDCRALTSTAPTPIEAVFPADCHQVCVGLNNTSLDDRYTSPSPETAKTGNGVNSLESPSNPTNQIPQNGPQSPQDLSSELQSDSVSELSDQGVQKMSWSERFTHVLTRVQEWAGKFDSVKEILGRRDSVKAMATIVCHYVVQVALFIFTVMMSVPPQYWVVLAVVLGSVSLLYMWRQNKLGVIREKNEQQLPQPSPNV